MKEYLTTSDAMKILKVSRTTIFRHVREGNLRSLKVGRLVRFRVIDLRHFIEGKPAQPQK